MIRKYAPEDKEAVLRVWQESARVAHPFWAPQMFDRERQAIAEQFLPSAETYVLSDRARLWDSSRSWAPRLEGSSSRRSATARGSVAR